jgi:signal transduction histidine kinase
MHIPDFRQRWLDQLSRHAHWMLRVRLGLGAALLVGALLDYRFHLLEDPLPLALTALCFLAVTVLTRWATGRWETENVASAQRAGLAQSLVDVAALTAFIYFCGGVENPALLFYLLPVAVAGLVLPTYMTYLVATAAVLLFGGVAVLQATVPSLHHPLPFFFPGLHYERWSFISFVGAVVTTGVYLTAYVTSSIRSRLAEADEQIVHNRDMLKAIIAYMTEAVVFLAVDGKAVLQNPSFLRWFRPGHPETATAAGDSAGLPEGLAQYLDRIRQAREPLPPETFEVRLPAVDGRPLRLFRASAAGVFDDRHQHLGYVIVAEDITELWQLEQDLRTRNREITTMSEALQRNQREMAQREKMVAVGTMAAGVAHEIGNPLACLSAVVQLLRRRNPTEAQREHFETMEELIRRIARIVRQLVAFARPAPAERSVAELDGLIEDTLKIMNYSRGGRSAQVESIRNPNLPAVRIVPQHFQQVLLNVMLNALDAVEEVHGERRVRVERELVDGWVEVRVRDWGCGMTPEQLRQAFEPFFTTKPPNKGTGLGLAVSYRLVESHGGRIHIESVRGQGTTVTITFPAIAAAPAAAPSERDSSDAEGHTDCGR